MPRISKALEKPMLKPVICCSRYLTALQGKRICGSWNLFANHAPTVSMYWIKMSPWQDETARALPARPPSLPPSELEHNTSALRNMLSPQASHIREGNIENARDLLRENSDNSAEKSPKEQLTGIDVDLSGSTNGGANFRSKNDPAMGGVVGAAPPGSIYVRAIWEYEGDHSTSLSFYEGDVIQVITQLESGWWDGVLNGVRGWFPSNYCEVVTSLDEFPVVGRNSHANHYTENNMEEGGFDEDSTDSDEESEGEGFGSLPLKGTNMDGDKSSLMPITGHYCAYGEMSQAALGEVELSEAAVRDAAGNPPKE